MSTTLDIERSKEEQCGSLNAPGREAAVAEFGARLGKPLTLVDQGVPPPYMMSEHDAVPHWVSFDIPVYEESVG